MITSRWNLQRLQAVVVVLTIGCAYWVLANGCSPTGGGNGNDTDGPGDDCPPENVCGNACCDELDSCIPNMSLCCGFNTPPCVDRCCDSGEVCFGGTTCCAAQNICGDVCCDDLDSGCIPDLSLCCGFDQDVCGDTCCAVEESCVSGTTCCPDVRICGDLCCPEGNGCDPQTNQCTPCPNPTDVPCDVGGCCPAGTFCQDVEGICCDPGEICCDAVCAGGCQPISECIN